MEVRKRTYNKPLLQCEAFVPNEYVAACEPENGITEYYLACTAKDSYVQTQWGEIQAKHSDDGCKRATAFTVSVNENGYITSIYEAGNNSGAWSGGECENITVNGLSASTVPLTNLNGAYSLTWTTNVGYDMPHSGTLKLSTAQKVNMS